MELSELTDSLGNLAEFLTVWIHLSVLFAGAFGLACMVIFSFVRKH